MGRYREWSKEEEQILRLKKTLGISLSKIGEELGRSKGSIVGRCRKLGLCVEHGPRESPGQPYLAELVDWRWKRDHPW